MSTIVVIGAGMIAQRFVEALVDRDVDGRFRVVVIGEENHLPYDRIVGVPNQPAHSSEGATRATAVTTG